MIDTTTFDYTVFYYSLAESASAAILNDLYSQREQKNSMGQDNTDAALSTEETDFITLKLKEAFNNVSQKCMRWRVEDVLSYEYGKLNTNPDDATTGDIVVYRLDFPDNHITPEIFEKINTDIEDYINRYIISKWSYLTNQPDWQGKQMEVVDAGNRLDDSLAFRNTPPVRKFNFF